MVLRSIFLTISLCLLQSSLSAQLLWKISGNNLDEPSYLFGSIHLSSAKTLQLDSSFFKRLKSCDAFAMEVDVAATDYFELFKMMQLSDSVDIMDYYNDAQYASVDSAFLEKIGYSYSMLKNTAPIVLASFFYQSGGEGYTDLVTQDIYLKKRAKWLGKPILSLETIETQAEALKAIPIQAQVDELLSAINGQKRDVREELAKLEEIYLKQDLDNLFEYTAEHEMWTNGADTVLLQRRNRGMLVNILSKIHSESLFAVVGAAHLGGEKGLIALLKENGYEIEPVPFQFLKN